ncbi:Uncharacterised protein [Staphylococcus aureus]|nr:Uncharacterised protein [Staphylococcus aureus]
MSTNDASNIISNMTYKLNKSDVRKEPITPTLKNNMNDGK